MKPRSLRHFRVGRLALKIDRAKRAFSRVARRISLPSESSFSSSQPRVSAD
jgi:hypothetical protein